MKIETDKVVSIDYTLKDEQGAVIDTSNERGPLSFIFGNGTIIPGLEKELDGKEKGDEFSVTVEPKDGYGEYDDARIFEVGKEQFQDPEKIEEGMQVQAQDNQGNVQLLTIRNIADEKVTLDANHPLAGQTLFFDVTVSDVREASDEELDHGHVH